ncbi:transcriptional regulator [Niastella yeongjuensis]|uniref:Transcriptional regulator n=1 Tax=Niastella yeongjuensis TaxID=354355 RepID=A0A1V9EV43_9BACT|nr:helix-turn-helix domain-containing protein [Niastella yeongjuensis]OQP49725.1 transcriptional regulator [Niastella yeongjuensis]SEP40834.1 transcriptional regulator, HxlR family [Niastella yeongjuensis]
MRKENSTNTLNKQQMDKDCGMSYTLNTIGGRWKPAILFRLLRGKMRYSELRDSIPSVTERMLVLQLRELEKDGLVKRIVYAEVPPRVEYQLTEKGNSLKPILKSLSEWGAKNRD